MPRAGAREVCGVGRQRIGKNLDRDITTELLIARAVDLSHASGAEHRQNLVAAKASSSGEVRGPTHGAAIIVRWLETVDSFRGSVGVGGYDLLFVVAPEWSAERATSSGGSTVRGDSQTRRNCSGDDGSCSNRRGYGN